MAAKEKQPTPAQEAMENPFRFFPVETVGKIFGFGVNTMTALKNAGAPVVARKMNPAMLLEWLKAHPDVLGKIRDSNPDEGSD